MAAGGAAGATVAEAGELVLIEALRPYLAPEGAGLELGAGDDAALWRPPAGANVVVTTDSLVEGVHFRAGAEEAAMADVGWKLLAVSLSDLAAMAATPGPAFLALSLPPSWPVSSVVYLYGGLADCAAAHGAQLAGGNFSAAPAAVLTSTCLGYVDPALALRRAGGEPGWALAVTGTLGGAAAALALERDGAPVEPAGAAAWRARLSRPEPRLEAARAAAAAGVRVGLDISDGLYRDAARLLGGAATGCVIDAGAIPLEAGVSEAWPERWTALAGGGEDYELLLAAPPAVMAGAAAAADAGGVPLRVIGELDSGDGVRLAVDGTERPAPPAGYEHFR